MVPSNERDRMPERIDPEKAMQAFENRDDLARPLTASDVAETLGCKRRTALNKLNTLEYAGRLESRDDVGGRARVFWVPIPAENKGTLEGTDSSTDDSAETVETATDTTTAETAELDETATEDEGATVADLGLSDEREAAVRAMRDLLRDEGTATKSDFTDLREKHPAGYSESSWWKSLGPKLGKVENVEQPTGKGNHKWRWVGDSTED